MMNFCRAHFIWLDNNINLLHDNYFNIYDILLIYLPSWRCFLFQVFILSEGLVDQVVVCYQTEHGDHTQVYTEVPQLHVQPRTKSLLFTDLSR